MQPPLRRLHYAGSIPVLHSVPTFQVHRCAPPVLRLRYGRGKRIFNTNDHEPKDTKKIKTIAFRLTDEEYALAEERG